MIATRTLSSERVALPLVEAICFLSQKLFSDGQDSLEHGQPGGCRQQVDEPLQRDAERREDEAASTNPSLTRSESESRNSPNGVALSLWRASAPSRMSRIEPTMKSAAASQ